MRKSASPHRFRGASNSSHRSSHTLSLERTTHTTSAVRGTFACTNKRSQSSVRTGCAAPKRIAKPAKHHPARRTRARLRARRSPRRSASSSMSTTSICTSTLCSSSINFEQIARLQRHDVRASSAALADLRGRQAQHVSERGLMSRAGQVRRAWVPGRDCAAQRILSVHGALGEHLNGRRRKRTRTHTHARSLSNSGLLAFPRKR